MADPVELAALVGVGAFARGRTYANQGRVRILGHQPEVGLVTAQCAGSGGSSYSVRVEYEYSPRDVLTAVDGWCSCPVGHNRKHVVATLITAFRLESGAAPAQDSSVLHSPTTSWRTVLDDVVPPAGGPTARLALVLVFSPRRAPGAPRPDGSAVPVSRWKPDYGSPGRLRARPMRMGKRGRWIVSGAAWSRIAQQDVEDADPEQLAALDELRRLDPDRDPYSSRTPDWLDLSDRMAPDLWRVLADIVASGVELVEADSFAPVVLESTPARADVAIEQDSAGDLHLGAVIHRGGPTPVGQIPAGPTPADLTRANPAPAPADPTPAEPIPTEPISPESRVLCGTPGNGVAWRDDAGVLRLAGFDAPVSRTWASLALQRRDVVVPAADRAAFALEMLPLLERSGWYSPDASFRPDPPLPPTLRLDITPEPRMGDLAIPGARLHWSWVRPGVGGRTPSATGGRVVPIDRRDRLSVDEGEAERALLGEVCDMLTGLEGAVEGRAGSAETPSRKGRPDRPGSAGRPGTPGHPMRPLQDALLQGADVVRLMAEVCPALEARGVEVRQEDLPELRDGGVPSVQMDVRAEGADWLDLEVRVEVADVEVPMAALVRALTLGEELLFLPDGTFAHLDDPALDHLRTLLEEAAGLSDQRRSSLRVPRVRLSWWEELLQLGVVQAGEHAWFQTVHDAVAHPPEPATVPAGLRATLRSYQVEGFQWLARLRRSGLGGVLADDMGLGKTVQVLAMVLDEREHPGAALVGGGAAAPATPPGADGDRAPWLVVAPTSVVANWVAEAQRFAPDLHVVAIEATAARRGLDLAEAVRGADLVVTSYALLRLEEQDYADLGVRAVVLDEAQNAKNHTSRTFAAVKKVGASQVFAITGTPMENHLGELWSMFALTAPGLLGTPQQFSQTFRRPLEHGEDAGGELLSRLRRRIAPFLLRRTKEDVALDLPPKQEQVLDVELAPAHRHVYDRLLQKERQRVLGLAEDLEHHQVEVLAALTRLRQLAIDPSLVDEGATAPSSKMEVLLPLLGRAAEEGHRVLVFSQFTRYLRRIAQRLEKAGIAYSYLDGTTPRRAQVIRGFAEGDDPVFLISLKAGGVGVNLAMADYAVLVDPWWNPAAEAQAVDRAHRIGQTRPVHVYRLVARDTIEEKVLALQQRKRDLAEGVLAGGADEVGVGESGAGEVGEAGADRAGALAATGSEGRARGDARRGSGGGVPGGGAGRRAAGGATLSAEDLRMLFG